MLGVRFPLGVVMVVGVVVSVGEQIDPDFPLARSTASVDLRSVVLRVFPRRPLLQRWNCLGLRIDRGGNCGSLKPLCDGALPDQGGGGIFRNRRREVKGSRDLDVTFAFLEALSATLGGTTVPCILLVRICTRFLNYNVGISVKKTCTIICCL